MRRDHVFLEKAGDVKHGPRNNVPVVVLTSRFANEAGVPDARLSASPFQTQTLADCFSLRTGKRIVMSGLGEGISGDSVASRRRLEAILPRISLQ